jgi:hypothetical protein
MGFYWLGDKQVPFSLMGHGFFDLLANWTPEENRQKEMELDTMAAYALAHEQGRNFVVALLVQATMTFYRQQGPSRYTQAERMRLDI